jgi:nucleoside phosphorylase
MIQEERQTHVVIITALAEEAEAVIRHLGEVEIVTTTRRTFYRATRVREEKELNIVLLPLSMMGNVEAAVATTQAIDVWNPQYLVLTGIAGGVKKEPDRQLGDIVIAEQIVAYEPARISDGTIARRYDVLRPAHELLTVARNLSLKDWALSALVPRPDGQTGRIIPNVHFGVVASGEKVIADSNLVKELQSSWSRLAGVEMEGYGVALAAYEASTAPGILLVKSLSDWADSSKDDAWRQYAADIAAAYTIALLSKIPFLLTAKLQARKKVSKRYSHRSKIGLCSRMGSSWYDLADYFDIPLHDRDRFGQGRGCQGVWDWLDLRKKLDGIEEGLKAIGRDDLIEELIIAYS